MPRKQKSFFDPEDLLDQIIERNIDPTIFNDLNEGDIPKAKNCVEFFINRKFHNSSPFPRQLQIALELFEEACPDCSDPKLLHNMYDQDLGEILDRIQLLHFGVCPKCKKSKWDFYNEGKIHFKHTLKGCAGQRCVVGDTVIQTEDGFTRIQSYNKNNKIGFSNIKLNIFDGNEEVKANKFFKSKKSIVKNIDTEYGFELGGTKEHPIQVFDFNQIIFKKLKNIKKYEVALIKYNNNYWPKKLASIIRDYNSVLEYEIANRISDERKERILNTSIPKKVTIELAKWLGLLVSEGHIYDGSAVFTNSDKNLLDEFEFLSYKLFKNFDIIHKHKNSVRIGSGKVVLFLKLLGLEGKSKDKLIPRCILESPKYIMSAFLSRYFEGDGGMEGRDLTCCSLSKKLIREIQYVLMNYGILPFYSEGNVWATNGTENQVSKKGYFLKFNSPGFLKLFRNEIGFVSYRKKKRLDNAIYFYDNKRVNKCPFICETLEPLSDLFSETIDLIKRTFEKANLRQNKHKNIAKDHVGFSTLFGGARSWEADKYMRIPEDVALNRSILKQFFDVINTSKHYKKIIGINKTLDSNMEFFNWVNNNDIFFDYITKIGTTKETTYDFHIPKTHKFWSNGFISHNSGKSYELSEFLMPYILHRYLTLGTKGQRISPQRYFKLLPSTILRMTCVARTVGKAQELLWTPFSTSLSKSPWFTNYHNFLKDYEKSKGEQLLHGGVTFLYYSHKLIGGAPAAPDVAKLRGDTRIFEAVDEIDWFDTSEASKKVTMSAEEIATSLNNSLRTIRNKALGLRKSRPHWLSAYTLHISSPSSIDGKILRDIASASKVKTIAAFHYPTWEMNPEYTRESLQEEYDKDPIKAARDFGAVPPLSDSPFFENIEVLIKSSGKDRQNIIDYNIKRETDNFGDSITYIVSKKKFQYDAPMCMAIDMGHAQNGFSIALGHLEINQPTLDFLLNIEPDPNTNTTIDTHLMFEHAIVPILDNYKITHVAYDQWNSLDGIRRIRNDYQIEADKYSIKNSDFEETISMCINDPKGMIYPKPLVDITKLDITRYDKDFSGFEETLLKVKACPISTMMLQMLTVRKVGMRVIKPVIGNDDAFRALSLLIVYLLNEDINYKFRGSGLKPNAFVRGNSMGSIATFGNSVGRGGFGKGNGSVTRVAKLGSSIDAGGTGGKMGRVANSRGLAGVKK